MDDTSTGVPRLVPRGYLRKRILEYDSTRGIESGRHYRASSWKNLPSSFSELDFNTKVVLVVSLIVVSVLAFRYYRKLQAEKKREKKRLKQLKRQQRKLYEEFQNRQTYKEALIPEASRTCSSNNQDEGQDQVWADRGGGFFKDPTPAAGPSARRRRG